MSTPVCARCPRALGVSCCEAEGEERLALLTPTDIVRIRDAVRRRAETFVEEEWVDEAEAAAYEARRPLYRGYFRKGPRRQTLRRVSGACVFLDRRTGCTLSPGIRPTACLLYPFDQLPDGSWSLQVSRFGSLPEAARARNGCLAVEEGERMDDVLDALGLDPEAVEALGERLWREVQAG
jgi:Fe-S-cluster containining protein